jgi:GNAT superfamily N-acetyltransferase
MNIIQIDLANRKHIRDFLDLPPRIYRDIPQWVPPLGNEERVRLDPERYLFYRHSAAAFFLAYEQDLPVGRLAVLDNRRYNEYHHTRLAFFYLFESQEDPAIAKGLFDAAFTWAKERGLEKILGPKGFTVLDGLGLLVKGFEYRPAMGLAYNPPYYPALIEAQGFKMTRDLLSGHLDDDIQFPERVHELSSRIQERRGLHIERYRTRRDLRKAVAHMKDLYNGTLQATSGNMPVTDADIKPLADQIIRFADPSLIKIVMKEERPVGFLIAYPDISVALQKIKGKLFPFGWITLLRELKKTDWIDLNSAGILEEYRGLGGNAILYSELFKSVLETPHYRHAELIQVGTENEKMQREMMVFGVKFHKVHRIYIRDL